MRLVWALNAAINWPFSTYQLYPFLKSFLGRYEYTYKQRGRLDLSRKIRRGQAVSVDVAQFDNNTPDFLVEAFFRAFADKVGLQWVRPSSLSYLSPILAPVTGYPEAVSYTHLTLPTKA